jgi:hypothetical protein
MTAMQSNARDLARRPKAGSAVAANDKAADPGGLGLPMSPAPLRDGAGGVVGVSAVTRIVRLTFLAPDIVAAILAGKQPPELTANKLMADKRLPLDWREQRTALGFA